VSKNRSVKVSAFVDEQTLSALKTLAEEQAQSRERRERKEDRTMSKKDRKQMRAAVEGLTALANNTVAKVEQEARSAFKVFEQEAKARAAAAAPPPAAAPAPAAPPPPPTPSEYVAKWQELKNSGQSIAAAQFFEANQKRILPHIKLRVGDE
jgi:hypothetical protein